MVDAETEDGVDYEAHLCEMIRHTVVDGQDVAVARCSPILSTAVHVSLVPRTGRGASLFTLFKTGVVLAGGRGGDQPTERDERLACRRVCDGERGREALAGSAATCRASSSMRTVKALMPTPDEKTRARGGVTSAVYPPTRPHRLRQPVLAWQ